ncbi:MAG: DUF3316 domain-containing protein [Paludibacteraceae bacterium]|nr:DUF3316 domain-containing protein [Paludibacteraceae bacterium]
MERIVCVLSFCLVFLTTVFAEETPDSLSVKDDIGLSKNFSFGIGFGRENHHVSYLSPLLYSGTPAEIWAERINRKRKGDKDFYSLANLRLHSGGLFSQSGENSMHTRSIMFEYHYYYDWKLASNFHMLCGGYVGGEFGSDKMQSSLWIGNNPEFKRIDFSLLGLSFRPTLSVQTKRRVIKISNQFDLRLAGLVFSPNYTQLYSDVEKLTDGVDFNSFSEKIRFSNKFTVDLPLRKTTLRLGMLAERSKSNVNMIDNRTLNVQALVGFSFDYLTKSGRLNKNSQLKTIFE